MRFVGGGSGLIHDSTVRPSPSRLWQDPQTSRTLTLVSKTIQTLGSLSKSKSVSLPS